MINGLRVNQKKTGVYGKIYDFVIDYEQIVGNYPYNVLVNKCSGSYNTLDNPMAKLWIPNMIKKIKIQFFDEVK